MTREADYLIQSLFGKESLEEIPVDELRAIADDYPYSSVIQFLYTCKLKSVYHLDFPDRLTQTALFFQSPQWLNYQLSEESERGAFRLSQYDTHFNEISEDPPVHVEEVQPTALPVQEEIPIEPYHTIDYFASQGIKTRIEDEPKDDLGTKVKSFTAWLKTMKRIHPTPAEESESADLSGVNEVKNESPELIVTESMAEVYLKQGLRDKAIEVYHKLSLQNPTNSGSFAAKIEQIKANSI